MSRIQVKNLPRLKLSDLLRRRKMSLRQFLDEFGITTYETLSIRCDRMGVAVPDEKDFITIAPAPVNSPTEGVLVLEPEPIPQQAVEQEPEQPVDTIPVVDDDVTKSLDGFTKKSKKKEVKSWAE